MNDVDRSEAWLHDQYAQERRKRLRRWQDADDFSRRAQDSMSVVSHTIMIVGGMAMGIGLAALAGWLG